VGWVLQINVMCRTPPDWEDYDEEMGTDTPLVFDTKTAAECYVTTEFSDDAFDDPPMFRVIEEGGDV